MRETEKRPEGKRKKKTGRTKRPDGRKDRTDEKTGQIKRPAEKKKNNGSEKRKKSLKTDAGRLRPDKKKTVQPELNGLNRDHRFHTMTPPAAVILF